jgi:hypothetical protein
MRPERLRPPSTLDPSASSYGDWLHLNFADPDSGTIGLINVSLHGSPWDERSRAIGTVLVYSPEWGWQSHVEVMAYSEANIGQSVIALRDVAIAIDDRNGTIHASSLGEFNPFRAQLRAETVGVAFDLEEEMPLGHGWISWYLMPNMRVSGEWTIQEKRTILKNAPAYHDHCWGRWRWGDDFGWEWGCFLSNATSLQSPGLAFARTTDREHRCFGKTFLVLDAGSTQRRFSPENVALSFDGNLSVPLHRVPGAMAALHPEMAEPSLPRSVEISAVQGSDCVTISFVAHAAAQFVTADPTLRGYGFIHEIVGEYRSWGRVRGVSFEVSGYGVFEYVI